MDYEGSFAHYELRLGMEMRKPSFCGLRIGSAACFRTTHCYWEWNMRDTILHGLRTAMLACFRTTVWDCYVSSHYEP